jgi:hypothetical protein
VIGDSRFQFNPGSVAIAAAVKRCHFIETATEPQITSPVDERLDATGHIKIRDAIQQRLRGQKARNRSLPQCVLDREVARLSARLKQVRRCVF